jgi:methyl-accepting chemotaxis protein
MSTALQAALFVASLTFIILALCILPVAFHLRRKLEQLVITAADLKEKLQLLVEDSHEMVRNVTELSKRANQELDEVSRVVQTARQWTERVDRLVNEVGSAIEPPVHSVVRNINLFRAGVTTFLQVL